MTVPLPGPPPRPADPHRAVATAMAGLDSLEGSPPAEHVAVFERIHAALGEALAGSSPGPA